MKYKYDFDFISLLEYRNKKFEITTRILAEKVDFMLRLKVYH